MWRRPCRYAVFALLARGLVESLDRAVHRHGPRADGALAPRPRASGCTATCTSTTVRSGPYLAARRRRPRGTLAAGADRASTRRRAAPPRRAPRHRAAAALAVARGARDLGRRRGRRLPAAGRLDVPVQLRHGARRHRADLGARCWPRGPGERPGTSRPGSACSPRCLSRPELGLARPSSSDASAREAPRRLVPLAAGTAGRRRRGIRACSRPGSRSIAWWPTAGLR